LFGNDESKLGEYLKIWQSGIFYSCELEPQAQNGIYNLLQKGKIK